VSHFDFIAHGSRFRPLQRLAGEEQWRHPTDPGSGASSGLWVTVWASARMSRQALAGEGSGVNDAAAAERPVFPCRFLEADHDVLRV
jgi:hypothetical protein